MDEHVKDLFCCGHGVLLGLRSLKMLNASYNELTHLHGLSGCTELQQLVGFHLGFHRMDMGIYRCVMSLFLIIYSGQCQEPWARKSSFFLACVTCAGC